MNKLPDCYNVSGDAATSGASRYCSSAVVNVCLLAELEDARCASCSSSASLSNRQQRTDG